MQNSTERIADEILVMDAQRGRQQAFEKLVSRWQKRLWWHAYRLTGHSDAAWDITQESWLGIVRGLARLKEPDSFGSWAYRIVSNKTWNWLRRNGRESPMETETEDTAAATTEEARREKVSEVHDILCRLSRRAQVVLNLHYLEGFGLAEIAGILGMPEGTVKSRLHMARIEFKECWESLGDTSPEPISATGKARQDE